MLGIQSLPVLGQTELTVPPDQQTNTAFDEKFEHWPAKLKIGGTVILGGGGELPRQATAAFAAATDSSKRVVAIVFQTNTPATDSLNQTVADLKKRFTSKKSSSVFIVDPAQTSLPQEALDSLASAKGLWIATGSNPSKSQESVIQQVLKETGQLIERGGIVCVNGILAERFGKFNSAPPAANATKLNTARVAITNKHRP